LNSVELRQPPVKQEIDSVCWTCMSGRCMLEFHKISCWMGRCNCHFNTNLKISFTTCCRTYTSNIHCLFLALMTSNYTILFFSAKQLCLLLDQRGAFETAFSSYLQKVFSKTRSCFLQERGLLIFLTFQVVFLAKYGRYCTLFHSIFLVHFRLGLTILDFIYAN
jgi:hypothetical protein